MEFRGRQSEIGALAKIRAKSHTRGQMTVITGRRRIGKTRMIKESLKNEQYVYLFVSSKSELLLCQEYTTIIAETLSIQPDGQLTSFRDIFAFLIKVAKSQHLNLVIDEFQEFTNVNSSVFSDMQNLWDANRETIQMNLILSGSVNSLMQHIFENSHEPLFGRVNHRLYVKPLPIVELKSILSDYTGKVVAADFLTLYMLTGGVPKYLEAFVDSGALTKEEMLTEILAPENYFIDEGRNVLTEEFGKASAVYFSILSLIAAGRTSRGDIESVIQKDIGVYLSKLEKDYGIIRAQRPIFSKPNTRNLRFRIEDNFLNFWFRFFFKFKGALEIGNTRFVRQVIDRDFPTYAGLVLEALIREQLKESMAYSQVGNYWQRSNKNEIDVVAINELTKQAVIGEVKMNRKKISLAKLKEKSSALSKDLVGYTIEYRGYSLEDIVS